MRVLASTGHDGSCRNYRNRNGDSFAGTCLLGTDRLRPGARKWTPGIQKMHPSPAVASGAIDVSENSLEQPAPERDNRAPSLPIPPPLLPLATVVAVSSAHPVGAAHAHAEMTPAPK